MRWIPRPLLDLALRLARVYWRIAAPVTVGVHAVVTDQEGRVLLVKHGYGRRRYHLPGGGIRRRETLTQCLQRELAEETTLQLTVPPEELELLGAYTNFLEGKSDHSIVFIVPHGTWTGSPDRPSFEIDRIGFFDVDDLPDKISEGTLRRVEEFVGKKPITHTW